MKIIKINNPTNFRVGDVLITEGISNLGIIIDVRKVWHYVDVKYISGIGGEIRTISFYSSCMYTTKVMR